MCENHPDSSTSLIKPPIPCTTSTKLEDLTSKMEKTIKELSRSLTISESKKSMIQESLVKYITKCEVQQKKDKKLWVEEQQHRLGRFTYHIIGSQHKKVWEDGEAFLKLKSELDELTEDRDYMEKQRKVLRAKRKQEFANGSCESSEEGIAQNDLEYQRQLDLKEEKEILTFKLGLNQKSIQTVQEKLDALEKEKLLFQVELNRISEEEGSKLCGKGNKKPYEILNNRYLFLSLLGRGGYSEVYRAYDLEK